jgi:hypothetical protein
MKRATLGRAVPRQRIFGILAACGVLSAVVIAAPTSADAAAPGIIPPQTQVDGRTYSQWSAAWWQWQLQSRNVPTNPNADPNPGTPSQPEGVDCAAGQAGHVWFLAGISFAQSPTYTTAYRSCSVPAGVFLFFPVVSAWNDNLNCPSQPPFTLTAQQLEQNVQEQTDGIIPGSMSVTIDGAAVSGLNDSATALRAAAGGFSYTLPPNSLVSTFCPGDPFPAGTTPPLPGAFADGVYILRAPLSAGVHHVHWTGQEAAGPLGQVSQDVTYTISVPG